MTVLRMAPCLKQCPGSCSGSLKKFSAIGVGHNNLAFVGMLLPHYGSSHGYIDSLCRYHKSSKRLPSCQETPSYGETDIHQLLSRCSTLLRADEISEAIKRETEAIRARFADPPARMFPVAFTFLIPEKMEGA